MLRCTAAGLIPLLNSKRYTDVADQLFAEKRKAFDAFIEHNSYYLMRTLPQRMAKSLLQPALAGIAAKQLKNGLWRGKNSTKLCFDILSAIDHAGLAQEAKLPYSPLETLWNCHDEYALLVKQLLHEPFTQADTIAVTELKDDITRAQETNGSFGQTVTETVVQLERLLALGMAADHPVIRRGAAYLLSQRKAMLQGMHTSAPYSLAAPNIFTTENRESEFQAALALKPEWLPRHVCFHTMAMIPNAVCLNLLLRLGLEDDAGVSSALQAQYALYQKHGGFCATDIKKPYL